MLLDLHNLYANSVNFGFDPYAYIDRLPEERIRVIHLAGGRWIRTKSAKESRLLDDHLHDVPNEVYNLLSYVRATGEPRADDHSRRRDGRYPPIEILLAQLERARTVLAGTRQQPPSQAHTEAA